jgi:molybdenum cofactor biosynthesis enzyme MoaA
VTDPASSAALARDRPPLRVVLVDCYVHERGFVRDESFRTLSDQLRAEGADAKLLDLVHDDPPPGKAMDDVRAAVRAAAPGLVVVSRAWSAALVDALRDAAGPGARIVRHSHGAPSAIDAKFDLVLDTQGIRDLLGGAENIAAPNWRRTRGEMGIFRSTPVPNATGTPTISGPAKGCPFLIDVRSSPMYRDSGIDFERVQTKGCSFCLDNVGAFASFAEDVIVAEWLAQLRALRRQRPDLREVLLTDERPHPYLPALFRAILAEPALHGIELLMKTRVDWLAEFAATALEEACTLAARSHCVLHVYLVGFESFHQPDLNLFNKAVAVADNIRAIEILRALEARHPRSFEFRRHRAHGFLLFHPWSTPESLLDNARVMRAVRFHELRSQARRTRLRLYASVPLHALAERQGLLVQQFEESRGDRAVEQGYDASVPWRFADARIEAIFRAVNRIAEALPSVLEADILEMVTSFVLRWPVFADAPDLAALPLLQAPLSWGTSAGDVFAVAGAAVAGFDPEVEAVAGGEKAGCLKESVRREEAADLVRAYETMGLAASVVSTYESCGDADGTHHHGGTHAIVAVARDPVTLEGIVQNQRAVERGEKPAAVLAMGQLMGYPACCVETYAAKLSHDENPDLERAPLRTHPDRPLAPLVNRFGAVSLVSHFLCAPDCAAAVALAGTRLAAAAAIDPVAADRITRHLSSPVLRLDYQRGALLEGTWEEDRYVVGALRPFAGGDFGCEPASVRAIRLASDGVTFELADGRSHIVFAKAPVLIEPGTVLAAPARRAIQSGAVSTSGSRQSKPDLPAPFATREEGSSDESKHPPLGVPEGSGQRSPLAEGAAPPTDVAAALAPGTPAGTYVIECAEPDGAGGLRVTLAGGGRLRRVLLRPWDPSRTALSRRGQWALDLDVGGPPSEADRMAVGALARLLPAGHHHKGTAAADQAPAQAPARDAGPGVICTAPWTTLEVVDPDGRVRQCCTAWTVGDRGNLHEWTLLDVWNGDGYRMARRVMGGGALGTLCRPICPRLYDRKFAQQELSIVDGAPAFVANQKMLLEDISARREVVRAQPLYIAVCPSTYCNYDCIMCLHGRSPRRDLPESVWDDLLTMLPTLRVLTLLGGEPLANPLAMKFLRAWDRTKYPDAAVSIVTNGSLLSASVLAHLERCHFANVTVSLNAGTPEVYAQVQRGLPLQDVLDNVNALVELRRRQRAEFPIILSFVVQPANHTTLIPFGELAHARGLPIRLQPLSPHGPEGLDFYGNADEVARILASLDAMAAWAERTAPDYGREIHGTRSAIAAESASRRCTPTARSIPLST